MEDSLMNAHKQFSGAIGTPHPISFRTYAHKLGAEITHHSSHTDSMNKILSFFFLFSILLTGTAGANVQDAIKAMNEGRYEKAMEELSKLANAGDDRAAVQMGVFFYEGKVIKQDYDKAMHWFLMAFKRQNADAFVNIGVMHRDGHGVPVNKKIAYTIFLTTHMSGLGSQDTQGRANSCLARLAEELSKEDIKDCLVNFTIPYVMAYIEARGKMDGIPEKFRPSRENLALKDLDWWMEGELDPILGPPSPEEKQARKEREEQRQKEYDALKHILLIQVKIPKEAKGNYADYQFIRGDGMGKSSLARHPTTETDGETIYELRELIHLDQHRYFALDGTDERTVLIYQIDHPSKPQPTDWNEWSLPSFLLGDSMDTFALLKGREPQSKSLNVPPGAPLIRFKVLKE
jgi:hypothetical protein